MSRPLEVLMVLGHRLGVGDRPSTILKDRVYNAFAMLEDADYKAATGRSHLPAYDVLLLTGGRPRPGQVLSEATVMNNLFAGLQTSSYVNEILLEHDSHNTLENLMNSFFLLQGRYGNIRFNIEAVTHKWHMPRPLAHWQKADGLALARKNCHFSIPRPICTDAPGGWIGDIKQRLGNVAVALDPDRTLLNWVRPHATT